MNKLEQTTQELMEADYTIEEIKAADKCQRKGITRWIILQRPSTQTNVSPGHLFEWALSK